MSDCVTGCTRPAEDYFLCRWCADDLSHWLSTVRELAGELMIATTRRARLGDPVVVSNQGPAPLPYDPHSAEAHEILHDTLTAWVRDVSHRTGHEQPTGSDAELALWLRARMHAARIHPAAERLTDEIIYAIRYGWRAIDRKVARAYVGPCNAALESGRCPTDLYARGDPSHPGRLDPRQSVIRCPDCGTEWDASDRREWLLAQLRDCLATAREISGAGMIAGRSINVKTVRSWAERGLIATYPHPAGGPKLYQVGEVIDRAAQAAARR